MSAPMMINRRVLIASVLAAMLAHPAAAASFEDVLLGQLRGLGFADISVEHTLLGRTRLLARRDDGTREIILNPRTGEILRDLWVAVNGVGGTGGLIDNSGSDDGSGGGSGSGGGDDDGGDDDGGDDSGGHGGGSGDGNSGPGGGGDDGGDDDDD